MIHHSKFRTSGLIRFIILLAAVFIVVSSIFFLCGTYYLQALLPFFSFGIEHINPDYEVVAMNLIDAENSKQLHFTIKTHRTFVDGQGTIWPSSDHTAGINAYTLYIHPILIFSLLLALPGFSLKDKGIFVLISLPFLFIIEFIDIPVHILYVLKEGYAHEIHQQNMQITWFHEFWYRFLNTGGRQFLSLTVVGISVVVSGTLRKSKKK